MNFILTFFVFVTLVFTVTAQKTESQCNGENEFWGCQSPTRSCQRLCENRKHNVKDNPCDLSCEKACVCEAGYLRQGLAGECVYVSDCNETEVIPNVKTNKNVDDKDGTKPRFKNRNENSKNKNDDDNDIDDEVVRIKPIEDEAFRDRGRIET